MGDELENWQIAVYWKREQMFYQGTIKEYDADTQQHLIAYDDGEGTQHLRTWSLPLDLFQC